MDLRDDQATIDKLRKSNQQPISRKQGEKLAHDIKAAEYMECSARTKVNIDLFSFLNNNNNLKFFFFS